MAITRPIDELTPEARLRLETGGALRNGQLPEIVDSSVLNTPDTIDFETSPPPSVFPVADLDVTPPLQPTQPERQAQGLTEQLQGLERELVGESAFRAESEAEAEIPALLQTQTDLTSQLKALQAEAKAIPLQLQQEATGRGITVGGLRPLQTGRLRENAIQALGVSSLLEASRGNLSTALTLVDRAVAQQFDPIREEINATTRNLELLLQSPATTIADKNRAQAQLDAQNARARQIDEQEAIEKQIGAIAVNAATAGLDPVTLRRIQQSTDPVEAQRIATEALPEVMQELDTQVIEVGGRKQLINTQTGEVIRDLGEVKEEDLQFVSGTKTQPAGYFNKATGIFTPIAGKGTGDDALGKADIRSLEQANTAITNIDGIVELLKETGAGTPLSRMASRIIPGTPAFDLEAKLTTVKALIGFDALEKMRLASPTGGALGQVSERELNFLQSVAGSLNSLQSNEQFKETLDTIKESFSTLTFMINAKDEGYTEEEIQDYLRSKGKL